MLRRRPLPNLPLLIPALAGVALAGYLTVVAILETLPAACAEGAGCDLVQTSRFASFFGIPTAAWGLAGYATLAAVALFVRNVPRHAAAALSLATIALGVSLYLTGVSIFAIGATCSWCLASAGLVSICFGVALAQRLRTPALGPAWRPIAGSIAGVALVGVLLHVSFQGARGGASGPEDAQLRALAIHLDEIDARFYGASWCSHCEEQKALFGASAHRLPYVECSPGGRRGPPVAVCRAAGVASFPTWIIRGVRSTGILSIPELAERSGFSADTESTATTQP
jgi:uncharacterized membrane protein